MPFLGKDWRSGGDQWVRTAEGWERIEPGKVRPLGNLNESVNARVAPSAQLAAWLQAGSGEPCREVDGRSVVLLKPLTGERTMRTTVAEALSRLDLEGAVRIRRRYNYVSKLLLCLIRRKMMSLSGMAQKIVINLLQQIFIQAVESDQDLHFVQTLLDEMTLALSQGQYDHVGSRSLWDSHVTTVQRLQQALNEHVLQQREDDGRLMLSALPDDVIHAILLRLADHRDVISTGRTSARCYELSEERRVWRALCLHHFTNKQWLAVFGAGEDVESVGWKELYSRLYKRYGMRELYAEMLELCCYCNALFWQRNGHTCVVSDMEASSSPVSPEMFVTLLTA